MKPKVIVRVLLLIALLLISAAAVLGQSVNKPKAEFTAEDRATINAYFKHQLGELAPGSLDRKGFPPDIDKDLKPGKKLPLQLEKQLVRLPRDLESKLRLSPPGYEYYQLGHHVLMLQRSDLLIADIVRDAGWK